MGIFDMFRKKNDANLELHKEFLVKATIELAKHKNADISDFRGFLCPRCYEKQAMLKSDVMKMPSGKVMKCSTCGEPMIQVF